MGGFHSLHISRYYPNTFDYVGLFSPAILPNNEVSPKVYDELDGTLKLQMENGHHACPFGSGANQFTILFPDFRSNTYGTKCFCHLE